MGKGKESKDDQFYFDDSRSWEYCGRFKEGDEVHVKFPVKIRQAAHVKLKGIFSSAPIPYRFKTINPKDLTRLIVLSTPVDHSLAGSALVGDTHPLTYSLKTADGKFRIYGVPESILEGGV